MSNGYLEKIASAESEEKRKKKLLLGGGGAAVGASLVHKEYHAGNLTGRETLYHGTSKTNKEKILKEGLKPRGAKGIIDEVESINKKSLKSDGLSFMTRSKMQAHMYANQADRIQKGTFNIHDHAARAKDFIPSKASREGVIHVNAPTWKKDEFTKVKNPETKMQFRDIDSNIFTDKRTKKLQKKTTYDAFEKKVFTNKGTVHNKYMKGSDAYVKNSIGEIGSFIKAHPNRFLKGVAKSGLGAGLIAGGSYLVSKNIKKENGK